MTRKIFFTPQNISSVAAIALCFGASWVTNRAMSGMGGVNPEPASFTPITKEATVATPEIAAEADTAGLVLDLIADDELGATIQVRATYLLKVGRDSGNAKNWLEKRRNDVQWEVNELRKAIGTFDGDPVHFASKTNGEAELAATELALHWIANPSDRNEVPSIPVNRPIDFYSTEAGPTQGIVPDDE
ncbi:MAG: hypothetical protein AAF609_12560 [Cyanobacteria bacterium P01_C01_bin.120]